MINDPFVYYIVIEGLVHTQTKVINVEVFQIVTTLVLLNGKRYILDEILFYDLKEPFKGQSCFVIYQ